MSKMFNNLNSFVELFYSSTYVPIRYYNEHGVEESKHPAIEANLSAAFSESTWSKITGHNKNPYYYVSDRTYASYGIVRIEETGEYVIIGPVFDTMVDNVVVNDFVKGNQVSPDLRNEVTVFLQNIPLKNHFQFINQLIFLNFCLNNKQAKLEDYLYLDSDINIAIPTTFTEQNIERKETSDFHNTYLMEQKMFDYVRRGEKKKLKDFLLFTSKNQIIKEGKLADSPLRQAKNIFLASLTKIGNLGAIKGGMDIEEAYQLMDLYSQECERLNDINSIQKLNLAALEDFCDRIYQTRLPNECSKEIIICMNFINNSTNTSIQVPDVADYIGKSTSYISKKFKDEVGESIGSYIMKKKLEDAKHLLSYSNKSLSEISNYLCFSSQSYFQNLFKKKYGITPAKFRNSTYS